MTEAAALTIESLEAGYGQVTVLNAVSLAAGGDAGAGLALQRADDDLTKALQQAPWITPQQGGYLLNNLHGLEAAARAGSTKPPFASNVDRLASDIDTTFGLTSAAS